MTLALYGSGEFTKNVVDIDEHIIKTYRPQTIAILPTAAGQETDFYKWLDMANDHYRQFNLPVISLPIINAMQANDPQQIAPLEKADWIFFSGGDPNYLYSVLKDSQLWDMVKTKHANGTLVSGSSAGAMIMGTYIMARPIIALINSSDVNWTPTFGLVPFTVLPHFNRLKKHSALLNRFIINAPEQVKSAWVGIDEDTALIIDATQHLTIGRGQVESHLKD